jgi:hypothetical protein
MLHYPLSTNHNGTHGHFIHSFPFLFLPHLVIPPFSLTPLTSFSSFSLLFPRSLLFFFLLFLFSSPFLPHCHAQQWPEPLPCFPLLCSAGSLLPLISVSRPASTSSPLPFLPSCLFYPTNQKWRSRPRLGEAETPGS